MNYVFDGFFASFSGGIWKCSLLIRLSSVSLPIFRSRLVIHLFLIQIMSDTVANPKIKDACHADNRLQDLEMLSEGLERCQKSLNDYLDSKRNAFPRFFFISDDELLSILGSSDPSCVQEHMIKVKKFFFAQFFLSLVLVKVTLIWEIIKILNFLWIWKNKWPLNNLSANCMTFSD